MRYLIIVWLLALICSCSPTEVAKPRPYQYPRVELPDGQFASAQMDDCPFEMEIPSYAHLVTQRARGEHPCWFDIRMDRYGSTVHCSYYPITEQKDLDALIQDAYAMAAKHNVMADYREEYEMVTHRGYRGLIFKIEGPVATPYQFYLSDEQDHFLRGSLYFDQKIDVDSMGPIVEYIEGDIQKMLSSLEWKS